MSIFFTKQENEEFLPKMFDVFEAKKLQELDRHLEEHEISVFTEENRYLNTAKKMK